MAATVATDEEEYESSYAMSVRVLSTKFGTIDNFQEQATLLAASYSSRGVGGDGGRGSGFGGGGGSSGDGGGDGFFGDEEDKSGEDEMVNKKVVIGQHVCVCVCDGC